ncbi:MAG: NAD(P)-dependent oxidoreductase [Lachnospiraceae bacterium]|nr:NAD(P)-dependent oxidoreductase [Lachnospiraceae bacterium]
MKIVVLGATGYLGSRLVNRLAEEDHEVLCLKRENSSLENLLPSLNKVNLCNVSDFKEYLKNSKHFDCLINAACKYPSNSKDDREIFESNLFTPLNVFFNCREYGINRLITIGTGLPDEFNAYAFSKRKFADICKWYGSRSETNQRMEICNIELENYYGEDEPQNRFLSGTIKKLKINEKILLTEGDQKRDFIYIDDVIQALMTLLNIPVLPDYIDLPLGTGIGVPIKEIVKYLKDITNSKSELCFGALEKRLFEPDSIADCTKMKQLGIEVKYGWQEGLKKII